MIASSRCLRERALFSLYEGEGTGVERAHLQACARCATRYDRLVADVDLVAGVLRRGPVAGRPAPRTSGAAVWLTATALATVALVLGVRGFEHGRAILAERQVVSLSLGEVSAALFAVDGEDPVAASGTDHGVVALQAALHGERPCDDQDPLDDDCE